jgi:hypothetical protein
MIGLEANTQERVMARTRNGNPKGKFRCCICQKNPVFLWYCTMDLPADEYGICGPCASAYTKGDDELAELKKALRGVTGIIPWQAPVENVQPAKNLEEWEDDLFD